MAEDQPDRISDENIVAVLTDLEATLANAWVEGDREFIERTIADDRSVTDPSGRVLTKAEVMDEAFRTGERHVTSMRIDDVLVRVFDGWAIVTGRTRAAGEYHGETAEVALRFTDVFANRNGEWQAVASHATLIS